MAGVFPMDDEGLGDLAHNGHEIHSDDDCIEVGFFQIKWSNRRATLLAFFLKQFSVQFWSE